MTRTLEQKVAAMITAYTIEMAIAQTHDVDGKAVHEAFGSCLRRAVALGLERAAHIAEVHGHIGPFGDSPTDRIAAYSTKTCQLIAQAVRAEAERLKG